ncbi:hypothetical protein BDA96_06G077600 [Sorghum bicolor]|uniref:Uncharacterized protein n=2 Tax=Sorghum bicolor TaxID=4558 RepID=A0A921QSA4_SORBI|nr:hypothetical protein BDA96_06G077600 [Sorghum bicolor]OQU77840.1 hypothetical protein SORBI_3009G110366 [Sorghum bicolor]
MRQYATVKEIGLRVDVGFEVLDSTPSSRLGRQIESSDPVRARRRRHNSSRALGHSRASHLPRDASLPNRRARELLRKPTSPPNRCRCLHLTNGNTNRAPPDSTPHQ